MRLSRHHKGMKIPASPPGLATFPLSNFWRGGEEESFMAPGATLRFATAARA
jgi:hypothetical protein